MPRTPVAPLFAALLTLITIASSSVAPAGAATPRTTCANRLCTKDRPGVPSCVSRHGYQAIARCYIDRAARHYRQSPAEARFIAYRESRYHWTVTNASAHRGLYQFTDTLWRHTPYHRRSPYSPRYAPLAAMWLWKHGYKSAWACC